VLVATGNGYQLLRSVAIASAAEPGAAGRHPHKI
jgi:hypothetical protein